MGVLLKAIKLSYYRDNTFDAMNVDVRKQTVVSVLFRRSGPNAWHIQGVFCDTNEFTGEELAIAAATDETYFIVQMPVNVALPERVVEHVVSYCPRPGVKREED